MRRKLGCLCLVLVSLCILALCTTSLPLPGMRSGVEGDPQKLQTGANPPGGGTCADISKFDPDNPFLGWPVPRFEGDWKTISSWFCDPEYFRGYVHWGIDLAVRVTRTDWDSIDGADVVCTSADALVLSAIADGGMNYGMGNHVIIRAMACTERCGDGDEHESDGQHIYLVEADSIDCKNEPRASDWIQDCRELKWKASYFHLLDVNVSAGDHVRRDWVLGQIDNSGNSTGPHLHYQINGPGGAIDPAPAMCEDYDGGLRTTDRWVRPVCVNPWR